MAKLHPATTSAARSARPAPQSATTAPRADDPDGLHGALARAVAARTASIGPPLPHALLQRGFTVFIDDREYTEGPLVNAIAEKLSTYRSISGEVWFNSEEEAWGFVAGRTEGIGVWHGRWVNLAGLGTIVFGEEHDEEAREEFVRALGIRHRLLEGASERSLFGVLPASIPAHGSAPTAHARYDGSQGMALENYWLASAQFMTHHGAVDVDNLRVFADSARARTPDARPPSLARLSRPGRLLEIIRTLLYTTLPAFPPRA